MLHLRQGKVAEGEPPKEKKDENNEKNYLHFRKIQDEDFEKGPQSYLIDFLEDSEQHDESSADILSDFTYFDTKFKELKDLVKNFLLLLSSTINDDSGLYLNRTNDLYSRIILLYQGDLLHLFQLHQRYLFYWVNQRCQNSYLNLQTMVHRVSEKRKGREDTITNGEEDLSKSESKAKKSKEMENEIKSSQQTLKFQGKTKAREKGKQRNDGMNLEDKYLCNEKRWDDYKTYQEELNIRHGYIDLIEEIIEKAKSEIDREDLVRTKDSKAVERRTFFLNKLLISLSYIEDLSTMIDNDS